MAPAGWKDQCRSASGPATHKLRYPAVRAQTIELLADRADVASLVTRIFTRAFQEMIVLRQLKSTDGVPNHKATHLFARSSPRSLVMLTPAVRALGRISIAPGNDCGAVSRSAGGADILARLIGQKLNEKWGQPIIVDNKPGAGGRHRRKQRRPGKSGRLHAAGWPRAAPWCLTISSRLPAVTFGHGALHLLLVHKSVPGVVNRVNLSII